MNYWVLTIDDDHQRDSTSIHFSRHSAEHRLAEWFTERSYELPREGVDLVEWANEQENEGTLRIELVHLKVESSPDPMLLPEDLVTKWGEEDFEDGNVAKVKEFIQDCVATIGGGFHPDTPFEDYVTVSTGAPLFSVFEAEALNAVLASAWDDPLSDPYAIVLDAIHAQDRSEE